MNNMKKEKILTHLLSICAEDAPQFLNDVYNKKYTSEKIASRFAQSGRSMIEMLGVLAIIGVLSVGGIAGYSRAMEKFKINKTINQISHISQNIRRIYTNQKCYALDSAIDYDDFNLIKNIGIIPDEMIDEQHGIVDNTFGYEHYIHNLFGGGVFIIDDSSCIGVNGCVDECQYKAFTINYFNLPRNICVQLAMMDWNNIDGLIYLGIYNANMLDSFGSVPISYNSEPGYSDYYNYGEILGYDSVLGYDIKKHFIPTDAISKVCDCTNNDCTMIFGFL